ncbi:MAG: hypothetical protein ACYC1I_11195 [Acidimicrobiales bacterium]
MIDIQIKVQESRSSTNALFAREMDQLVQHIRMAIAPKNLYVKPPQSGPVCIEPPQDGAICIGRVFRTSIKGVSVPCIALIPGALVSIAGIGDNPRKHLESALVQGQDGRWFRSVRFNGVVIKCFVIRLSDFNKSDGGQMGATARPCDNMRHTFDLVRAVMATGRYYLIPPKPTWVRATVKVTAMLDVSALTSDDLAEVVDDRKELERRIEQAFPYDDPEPLVGGCGATHQPQSTLTQHDLDELLNGCREVFAQAGHSLRELDDVINKVSAIVGLGRAEEEPC